MVAPVPSSWRHLPRWVLAIPLVAVASPPVEPRWRDDGIGDRVAAGQLGGGGGDALDPDRKSMVRSGMVTERVLESGGLLRSYHWSGKVADQAEHAVGAALPAGVEPGGQLAAIAVVVQGGVVDA